MDAARVVKGQGRPLYDDPRSGDGANEPRRSRGRMQGQAFLVTFFATEKSNSPSRAKPAPSSNSASAHESETFIQHIKLPVRRQPSLLGESAKSFLGPEQQGSPLWSRFHTASAGRLLCLKARPIRHTTATAIPIGLLYSIGRLRPIPAVEM